MTTSVELIGGPMDGFKPEVVIDTDKEVRYYVFSIIEEGNVEPSLFAVYELKQEKLYFCYMKRKR